MNVDPPGPSESSENLLREATTEAGQAATPSKVKIPDRIGPFKILEVLGEGGMGVVYLAEQTKPIRRRVALKLIKIGMDTKQIIARFETERQALAVMDQPGGIFGSMFCAPNSETIG